MAMPAKVFLPVVSRIAFASSTNQPRPLVTLQRLHMHHRRAQPINQQG